MQTSIAGYIRVLHFDYFSKLDNDDTRIDTVDTILLSLLVFALFILYMLSFHLDGRSWQAWKKIPVRIRQYTLSDGEMLGEILASLSLWGVVYFAIELDGTGLRAAFLWMTVLFCSFFFPFIVVAAFWATRLPQPCYSNHCILQDSKAFTPCLVSILAGIITAYLGILPTVDALLVVSTLTRNFPKRFDSFRAIEERQRQHQLYRTTAWAKFLRSPSNQAFYAATRIAMEVARILNNEESAGTVVGILLMLLLYRLIGWLSTLGIMVGHRIMTLAKVEARTTPPLALVDLSFLGATMGILWIMTMAAFIMA